MLACTTAAHYIQEINTMIHIGCLVVPHGQVKYCSIVSEDSIDAGKADGWGFGQAALGGLELHNPHLVCAVEDGEGRVVLGGVVGVEVDPLVHPVNHQVVRQLSRVADPVLVGGEAVEPPESYTRGHSVIFSCPTVHIRSRYDP